MVLAECARLLLSGVITPQQSASEANPWAGPKAWTAFYQDPCRHVTVSIELAVSERCLVPGRSADDTRKLPRPCGLVESPCLFVQDGPLS